ncbi:DUF4369 domain-containing protein [Flavobacteriaceae bacterium]|nr:DUF4369 domain-containing protein [Flavobacteriaceae bacterium]
MKKLILLLFAITFLVNCKQSNKLNTTINGTVVGLQKGTIYLQEYTQNGKQTIDSITVNGTDTFVFNFNLKEPQLLAITLNKNKEQTILLFAEQGTVDFKTQLHKFAFKASFKGFENQKLLEEHDNYTQKIKFQNLDLIKEKMDAVKSGASKDSLKLIEDKYNRNLKRMYLFTTNYAIQHKNTPIAPYLALTKMERANPILKEKIYNALSIHIKESKYGLLLKKSLNL